MKSVWRCTKRFWELDGGTYINTLYAKTFQEMLILKDQGYECVEVYK